MTAFADQHTVAPAAASAAQWSAGQTTYHLGGARLGVVVPVLGAHGQAGTSGMALALADAAAGVGLRVLLVDCADPARSGLAGVAGIEGRSVRVAQDKAQIRMAIRALPRGRVATRRLVGDGTPLQVSAVPLPLSWAATVLDEIDITVVDVGWDVWHLMAPSRPIGPLAWCGGPSAATFPVMVLRPAAGSVVLAEGVLTRYASATSLLGLAHLLAVVAVGAEAWPPPAQAVMGLYLQQAGERVHFVPATAQAAVGGWGTASAPAASIRTATAVLQTIGGGIAAAVGQLPARRGRRRTQP